MAGEDRQAKNEWRRQKGAGSRKRFALLEELVILLVKADGVLAPKLLRLVHGAPLQAAGLELRAVLIE